MQPWMYITTLVGGGLFGLGAWLIKNNREERNEDLTGIFIGCFLVLLGVILALLPSAYLGGKAVL